MNKLQKHILVVSQYFYPEPFRINDICAEWVKRGFKVTVLTGIPNYPTGKFYTGYSLSRNRIEEREGIKIIRIPLVPRGNNSIGLITNYVSFVMTGLVWKMLTKIKADYVFIFEVSPMTQALVGVEYARKHNIPCYLYVQDLWPENVEIMTNIHHPIVIEPISKMVNYIYKNCAHIFATSPSFVAEIQKRCEGKNKVSYWPQYAEDFYRYVERNEALKNTPEIPANDNFKIIFTGNIGKAQGLEILPIVAGKLKKNNKKVQFIIVGEGRNQALFEEQIRENNTEEMFVMTGRQKAERIPDMLGCCDVAFLSFMNNKLFEKTIPAKLQSYMACGIPILASACGETERIIEEAECGICTSIGDSEALYAGITKMLEMDKKELDKMGKSALSYYNKYFNKKDIMEYMDSFLSEQVERERRK